MSVKIKIKELFKNNKPIVVALVLIFFLASGWSILNSQKSLFSCSALAKENSGTSPSGAGRRLGEGQSEDRFLCGRGGSQGCGA